MKLKPYQTILLNDQVNKYELTNVITEYNVSIGEDYDLKLQPVGNNGYKIGFIQGKIQHQKLEDGDSTLEDKLVLIPTDTNSGYEIHIGDIKITNIYNKLKASGFQVDLLSDGRLVIDAKVIVRKSVEGHIQIEGIDYVHLKKVKKVIMDQLAHIRL